MPRSSVRARGPVRVRAGAEAAAAAAGLGAGAREAARRAPPGAAAAVERERDVAAARRATARSNPAAESRPVWTMAVTRPPKLDMQRVRADFPYLEELVNGKPVAYLDSAASAQKPRQVLDAMREFYAHPTRTSTAASTGSPSARPRPTRARARRCAPPERAGGARDRLHPQRDRGAQPRRVRVGARQSRPGRRRRHHGARAPLELRPVAVHRGPDRRDFGSRSTSTASCSSTRSTGSPRPAASRSWPTTRLQLARHDQPDREARRLGARAGAIMVVDAAQAAPHAPIDVQALGCDFLAFSGAQAVRPERHRRAVGHGPSCSRRCRRSTRRRDDPPVALDGTSWNELPYKFEAGTPADRRGVRLRRGDRLPDRDRPRRDRGARARADRARARRGSPSSRGPRLRPARRQARRHRLVQLEGIHPHDVAQILDWEGVASAPATTARSR